MPAARPLSRQHFGVSGCSTRQKLFVERVSVIHLPAHLGQDVIPEAANATFQIINPRVEVVVFTAKGRAARIEVPHEKPVECGAQHERR